MMAQTILATLLATATVMRRASLRSLLLLTTALRNVGVIEPLAVYPEKGSDGSPYYILLDGHLRLHALKEIGATSTICLVSTDDEGFTYQPAGRQNDGG